MESVGSSYFSASAVVAESAATAAAAPRLRPLLTSTPRPRLMLRTLWWVLQFKSRAHQMPRMEISRNKLPALKKLHDVGTISNEDFENKKAVLLSRM